MRTHTETFKEEIKKIGRQIKGKIIYYPSYDLISEDDDNILTEADLQLISEQANYDDPIEINEENIFSISIIKNGDLLQSLMKEFDFEAKDELNIGSVVNPHLGLLIDEDNQTYEYLDYGNYIVYSKEYNMDTQTWSYVCYDKMLFAMVKYKGLSNVTYPITIKQYINLMCNKIGLEFEDSNFVNYNQLIYEDLYKDKGLTYRDVFDEISKIMAGNLLINDDDKLEVGYVTLTSEASLPKGYTQVDYIESTGTQYLDTRLILMQDNSIEMKISSNQVASNRMLFGSRSSANSNNIAMVQAQNGLVLDFNNSSYSTYRLTYNNSINTQYILYVSKDKRIVYDSNKNVLAQNTTLCNNTITTPQTATLFYINPKPSNTWYNASAKIYYCKIWNNDTLVRDLIPCYRNSDNEVGMYDLVTNTFLTNKGTGTFTYGEIVSDTINEEYLKDTNVKMADKFGVINSVAVLDTDNDLQYIAEDTQSIKENEMTRITITDNLIALNGDTQTIADNVLNQLNGLYYYINDFATTGVCYYDYLDLFNVEARGNIYQCLLLNNEITISQGIEEQIFTEKLEESETSANEYTTSVMTNKQVQFKINQQEGKIESKVEKDGVISAINQSAEEIQINANKLSFEGATINMTADNVKIKGENLDIDSKGVITLTDNSAENVLIGETQEVAYIVTSEATATPSGTNVELELTNKVIAGGIDSKANASYEYGGTTTAYTTGIKTATYAQPRITLYGQSDDYNGDSIGSYSSLDMSLNGGISYSSINNGTTSTPLTITSTGAITCVSLTQTSKAESKKNFEKLTNAKEILNTTDIYKYNFKDEEEGTKKSIGFVIGDDFNYSEDITSVDNNGANIYSMVSVLWQVVKEQQEEINELKEMIKNGKY